MKILCLIPARSGSQGIKNKNIKLFKNKPLLGWSIQQAQNCKFKMKIVVSTDSEEYSKIAIQYGAESPFLRPSSISGSLSTDYEVVKHCLDWLKNNQNYCPDIIIQLRPTQPCRKVSDINNSLKLFIDNYEHYDSLRTVVLNNKSPYKMYQIENQRLKPLFSEVNKLKEPFNQARQLLPDTYLHNGYIDIFKSSIISQGTISGTNIYPYIMSPSEDIDIDTEEDWAKAEQSFSETIFL